MSLIDNCSPGIPEVLTMHVLGLPHCPRNRSHAIVKRGKAHFLARTEAARSYEAALMKYLEKYKPFADQFRERFDSKTQHLSAVWEFYSPEVKTKDGKFSENGTDLDAHKVLQDTVMAFVGIDDAYIATDTRTKIQGDYAFSVMLVIRNNDGSDLL